MRFFTAAVVSVFLLSAACCGAEIEIVDDPKPCDAAADPCGCSVEHFLECGISRAPLEPRAECSEFQACLSRCQIAAPCAELRLFADPAVGVGQWAELYNCNTSCGVTP